VIAVPTYVGEACLLLNASLTPTEATNCTNIMGRGFNVTSLTGANVMDVASVGVDLGILTCNPSTVSLAYGRVNAEVTIKTSTFTDGIHPDGSFFQHLGELYNGNYGST
jgi:hypothetical protein